MLKKFILFVFMAGTIYFFNACDEKSNPNDPDDGEQVEDTSYFPNEEDSYYKYSISRTDSNSNQITGTRSSFYSGTSLIGATSYQIQIDSLVLTGQAAIVDSLFFRKTNTGLFFYLDTTGLATSVPGLDTLIQYISLDSELRLLLFPLLDNSNWTVFKMNINYQGVLNFNPIELKTTYDGKETLNLELTPPRPVEAVRLKFTLTIKPGPFDPVQTYTAYAWIAQGIGFVKWQGSGTIVGVFTGNGVDLDDTTSVYTENLIEYNRIDQ
ncbi:MAG TPA: hypothetical protein VLN45_00650 [Ignavibacteriaceae bacterium]|nr:hypothetical protein [Ignavibacteriaceae bacterium]